VPVKELGAKSRLALPERDIVAIAMTRDVLAVARETDGVVDVVTVPAGTDGLDADLLAAAAARPDAAVAVLMADLPALRASELAAALQLAAGADRSVVADADGTGTVLLTARAGRLLAPAYGPGSRARHVQLGARDLTDLLGTLVPGLRCDVDTTADLDRAVALGVGPETAGALGRSRSDHSRTPCGGMMPT
jgi:2-phospho-L-lactate guanylyltransferase